MQKLVQQSSKQRHEIKGERIRALYGHSIPNKLCKKFAEPPQYLYHGTSSKALQLIVTEGLKPMNRHYVHLSVDIETAQQVGLRKSIEPRILKINANAAFQDGVKFYIGNAQVWLADIIPFKYVEI